MCTVIVLLELCADRPLVVAANRDELLARPWAAPSLIAPGILAPRDLVAGGTWTGATTRGFFAALTNIHVATRAPRSRGEIVQAVLAAGDLDGAAAVLAALRPGEHGPFNLLYGSAAGVRLATSTSTGLTIEGVEPGMTVVLNGPHDDRPDRRNDRARALIEPHARRPWAELMPILGQVLADHEGGICIHHEPFGTSSSSLMAFHRAALAAYLFAAGPPCRTPFIDEGS